jgi:hypothetical protein
LQSNEKYRLAQNYRTNGKTLILFLPSSDVLNEVIVSLPKPCLFPAATDISYVVNGVRLSIS